MSIPEGYDAVTFNHWLWYKYRCHEGSPTDFQKMFEDIMKRAHPEFVQIRPYGNIGDRKCDGLLIADSTVFQVYSPDELSMADCMKKIEEDLAGAVAHWGSDLKKWVFVFNTRRGLAPDIPKLLMEKKSQYEALSLECMSSDELWEKARHLSVQQRAEILGPPAGYEHLFLLQLDHSEAAQVLANSVSVIVHDTMSPISLASVVDALLPQTPLGAPLFIRPSSLGEDLCAAVKK